MVLTMLPATVEAAEPVPKGLKYSINGDEITIVDYTGSATELVIPATIEGMPVTTIGDYAFNNGNLTSVTIPDSVTTIGDYAFRNGNLNSITIPDSVTTIGDYAFSDCDRLTGIFVDSANPAYCSDTSGVLYNKTKTTLLQAPGAIVSYNIPDSVTTIGGGAFAYCDALTGITIPDSVTTIGYAAFSNCTSLAYNQHHNGYYLGNAGNPYLALIAAVDRDITSCQIHENTKVIGGGAFERCGNLANITIPDSVTAISDYAFDECHDLTSVTIPDSVTTIGKFAFSCRRLTSVTIGDSVTAIGDGAFSWCNSLASVTFTGNLPTIDEDCFLYTPHTTAYYPCNNDTWTDAAVQVLTDTHTSITWKANHRYKNNICTNCGGVEGVTRLAGSNRFDTAFKSADALKEVMGVDKFPAAIVTSGMNFADALAGSYLAARTGAPILLTDNDNMADVIAYILANVEAGGTVYALGGTAVVADTLKAVENSGYTFKRLAGASRFETNLMILEEAGIDSGDSVLVCTAYNFADSLSASALGMPILLVDDTVSAEQMAFLRENADGEFILVGGTGAVKPAVEEQLREYWNVERLAGNNRFQTSVLTAKKAFGTSADYAVLAYGYNFPDGLCAGPLAYALDAPLILTANGDEAAAAEYTASAGISDGFVLGGPSLINDGVVYRVFSMGAGENIK